MTGSWRAVALATAVWLSLTSLPAKAWDRGEVKNFATIPVFTPKGSGNGPFCPNSAASCTSDIEGVAVGPDGTVYTPSFGFNSDGALGGYGELFLFTSNGQLIKHFPVTGSSPHLIGLVYQKSSRSLLIADLGKGVVWKVNPVNETTTNFMTAPNQASAGLNALTFDRAGNVYVSDSFQGAIWKTGPNGGNPTAWYSPTNPGQNDLLPIGAAEQRAPAGGAEIGIGDRQRQLAEQGA